MPGLYTDDDTYYACIGDTLTQPGGAGTAISSSGTNNFAGVMGSVTASTGTATSASFSSLYSCSCTGNCNICPSSTNTCYVSSNTPTLSYDFTETSPYSWTGT